MLTCLLISIQLNFKGAFGYYKLRSLHYEIQLYEFQVQYIKSDKTTSILNTIIEQLQK